MRTREEILEDVNFLKDYGHNRNYNKIILEVLLDIREMLSVLLKGEVI
jgi:hypothetical protein